MNFSPKIVPEQIRMQLDRDIHLKPIWGKRSAGSRIWPSRASRVEDDDFEDTQGEGSGDEKRHRAPSMAQELQNSL